MSQFPFEYNSYISIKLLHEVINLVSFLEKKIIEYENTKWSNISELWRNNILYLWSNFYFLNLMCCIMVNPTKNKPYILSIQMIPNNVLIRSVPYETCVFQLFIHKCFDF